jgi:hypothetical protein
MKNIIEEVGFVRPDALREELISVKVIGEPEKEKEKTQKVDIIKVVNLKKTKQENTVCPSYFTQYYG